MCLRATLCAKVVTVAVNNIADCRSFTLDLKRPTPSLLVEIVIRALDDVPCCRKTSYDVCVRYCTRIPGTLHYIKDVVVGKFARATYFCNSSTYFVSSVSSEYAAKEIWEGMKEKISELLVLQNLICYVWLVVEG